MLNFKVGHFTWPVTGTTPFELSVTGLGFRPKVVRFYGTNTSIAVPDVTGTSIISQGTMNDAGEQFALSDSVITGSSLGGGGCLAQRTDRCFTAWGEQSYGAPLAEASYARMDADGFTINVTAYDASMGREVGYIAWGGDSLRASSIQEQVLSYPPLNSRLDTHSFAVSTDFLMFNSVGAPSSGNLEGTSDLPYCYDMALGTRSDAGGRGASYIGHAWTSGITTTQAGSSTCALSIFLRFMDGGNSSWLSNNTLPGLGHVSVTSWRNVDAVIPLYFHSLAMTGIQAVAQTIVVPVTVGSVNYTQAGFRPDGILFFANGSTGPGGGNPSNPVTSHGFTDGVNHLAQATRTLRSNILGVTLRRTRQHIDFSKSIFVLSAPASPLAIASGTVTEMLPTGFTINWDAVKTAPATRVIAVSFRRKDVAHANPHTFLGGKKPKESP